MAKPIPGNSMEHVGFSDDYKEKTFFIWYSSGKLEGLRLLDLLPKDIYDRKPNLTTISTWINKLGWRERADVLDVEVAHRIERMAIEEKVEMFNRHALVGREMQDKAIDYFNKNDITSGNVALRLLVEGVEIERQSKGVPGALERLSKMNNEELEKTVERLLQKADSPTSLPEIVDGIFMDESDGVENGDGDVPGTDE